MTYTGSKLSEDIKLRDIELLESGFTYAEISDMTGVKHSTIAERNRTLYKINVFEMFSRRIDKNGIPNRLNVSNRFGNWFSGFFDGEGCIVVWWRDCPYRYVAKNPKNVPAYRKKHMEYRLGVQIGLRDDDTHVIEYIHKNIGGLVSTHICTPAQKRAGINPTSTWRIQNIKDLAEIVIPLFDKYPLISKKSLEYAHFKVLVHACYVATLGGGTGRGWRDNLDKTDFINRCAIIKDIKSGGGRY